MDDLHDQVEEALDATGAPAYTPPAEEVGSPTIQDETIRDADGDTQGISIDTNYADGSRSHEEIDASLGYRDLTTHPGEDTTFHSIDSHGTTSESYGDDAAGGHHRDEERVNFQTGEQSTTHTETPPELSPEDVQDLEGL